MIMKILCVFSLLLIFNACNGQQRVKPNKEQAVTPAFEMVSVPAMITDEGQRANYLVIHYWDKFNFKDTAFIHLPEITEQAFSDFIDVLKYVSSETADSAIKGMMSKAEADSTMFVYFADLYEKYLYDPNSPMRNEELYIPVLQSVINCSMIDEVNKIRPSHQLELAMKNRLGEPATNFTFTLANGKKGTLYDVKSDYMLLYFYNPDCHACKEVTEQLAASGVLKEWEKNKKIKVLAVYPDEDLDAWTAHISSMPPGWINSYDETVGLKNDEVYDLKAIPTLYLLDKNKNVLLKDATFRQFEDYLLQQTR
ncbi:MULTISPECIES: DUF5106 domain-containing protein [Bacteroidales]|uniref:DUF5106 domain-containing protein n=1 Tax=Parabacteroides bouchesdurhonensis TaxID=1936995 RepID=UPI000E53819B|nr:DUF5106 domain-containing protein [Bacteroides sp. AM07-16]